MVIVQLSGITQSYLISILGFFGDVENKLCCCYKEPTIKTNCTSPYSNLFRDLQATECVKVIGNVVEIWDSNCVKGSVPVNPPPPSAATPVNPTPSEGSPVNPPAQETATDLGGFSDGGNSNNINTNSGNGAANLALSASVIAALYVLN